MLGLAIVLSIMTPPNIAVAATRLQDVSGPCRSIAARGRGLDRTLRSGVFRIRYSTLGKDAVANIEDANLNGVPDVIDDLSRQFNTAHDYYVHVLGLKPPLSQPRYHRASAIDVLVRNLGRGNGLSFDEAVREPGERRCKLLIEIDAGLRPDRNPTAAHELFHLFQYGYAMFKVPWYLEGMARWIEGAFIKPKDIARSMPVRCESVVNRGYAASPFWRSAASKVSAKGSDFSSRRPPNTRYVNNRPVIADDRFPGAVAKPILEHLQQASLQLSGDAPPKFDWPEAVQKSHRFDRRICRTVQSVLAE